MQLLITPLAAFDLEEIGDYIAQDNPVGAGTFLTELRAHCEKICLNPAAICTAHATFLNS
jgi:toxin ParE1/3/4